MDIIDSSTIELHGKFKGKKMQIVNANVLLEDLEEEDQQKQKIILPNVSEKSYKRAKVAALSNDCNIDIKIGDYVWYPHTIYSHKNLIVNKVKCTFFEAQNIYCVEREDGDKIESSIATINPIRMLNDFVLIKQCNKEEENKVLLNSGIIDIIETSKKREQLAVGKVLSISNSGLSEKIYNEDYVLYGAMKGFAFFEHKLIGVSQIEFMIRNDHAEKK